MGLTGCSASFSACMAKIFVDAYRQYAIGYVDDLSVRTSGKDLQHPATQGSVLRAHALQLVDLFKQAMKGGVRFKLKKSTFATTKMHLLGEIITTEGRQVNPAKVEAIRHMAYPMNQKGVKRAMGIFTWFS